MNEADVCSRFWQSSALLVAGGACDGKQRGWIWQSPLTAEKTIAIFCFTPTPAATAARNVPAVSWRVLKGRKGGREMRNVRG